MDGDASLNPSSEVSSKINSSKIRRLLNKEVLFQKATSPSVSLSLSPAYSLSEQQNTEEEMPSQSTVGKNKRKMRIRKKTTKRIDVLSISPDKSSSTHLKKRKTAEVSSDDLGPITWGTENRNSESVIPQEKTDIEKELQSLLIVTKNRQHESSVSLYQDSNSSINGVESDISLTQQIHSLQESANSIIISDMTLPSVTEKSPSVKCMTFVEGNEKEGSGFDSMLDSSLLEEVNRIEEETKNEVLNDSDLLSLAENLDL